MKKFNKFTADFLILCTVLVLGAQFASAYSVNFKDGFTPKPTYISCYSGFASETKTAISNACSQWNGAGSGNLVFKSSSDHNNTTYPLDNDLNQITSGQRGSNAFLGECTYVNYISPIMGLGSGYIYEADIDLNVSYPFANNGSSTAYDVGQVMTHEIGHLLGLEHSDVTGATMIQGSAKGETYKRTIEQDDKDGINNIY